MKELELLIGKLITSKIGVHVFFCLLFVLLFAIPVVLSDNRGIEFPALLTCLFILGCTYAGRWSGKRWLSGGIRAPFLRSLLLSVLILSIMGATGAAWLFRGSIPHYFVQYLAVCFPLVVLFIFLGLSIALVRNSILRQVTEARIREEQKESELRLLLSQLSPHFLFNTLNNIYGISITQHQRVPSLLLKLSELLRYSIYETRERFIPLKNELLYIHNYIEFEKIQTGDKLLLETDLEAIDDEHLRIAPMLLIVFVENAFKHSKNTRESRVFIAITLHIREGWIHFTLKNSYQPAGQPQTILKESSGVGLSHTLKRLALIYGNDYFYDTKNENGIYTVDLRLKAAEV
ncbi:histidine kinase [Flavitalea sp. BT771]|uniref:sensor histidine kinase n=1 Tax=Flavitalea sp. BT771 TaxID=3063329 RepID=UPI0026E34005|nr:histidine kinase [Flavitalea sp. BT771]MDO6432624.1 histidine kinase [Flavitalea sp. BT771]MDV6222100.1 histidine kinase [Flavitalea sp. BT771]